MAMTEATSHHYIPALGSIYGAVDEYAEPILRIALGAILIPHGMQKLFGAFGGMGFAGNAALFAFLCIALTLVVFFIWTYPANEATNNWTMIPDNWEQLRRDWEYSHAANAIVTFAALCSVTLSVLTTRERTPSGGVGVTSGERPH